MKATVCGVGINDSDYVVQKKETIKSKKVCVDCLSNNSSDCKKSYNIVEGL